MSAILLKENSSSFNGNSLEVAQEAELLGTYEEHRVTSAALASHRPPHSLGLGGCTRSAPQSGRTNGINHSINLDQMSVHIRLASVYQSNRDILSEIF